MMRSTEYIRLVAFLKRFDCNNREAATYIECLQAGMASVQEIARRLNSNRITVHSSVEQLIKKGLLFETRKGKKRFIVAESPDVLRRILQRKNNELKLIENDLDSITKLLHSIQNDDQSFWNVRVYEGIEDFKKILEEMVNSKNDVCVFRASELIPEGITETYLRDYYKRLAENDVHSRIICAKGVYADTFKEDQLKYKLQIKTLSLVKSQAGFYLWNDNIALKSFKDSKVVCTVIKNKDLSIFFRNILFDQFWNIAHPVV